MDSRSSNRQDNFEYIEYPLESTTEVWFPNEPDTVHTYEQHGIEKELSMSDRKNIRENILDNHPYISNLGVNYTKKLKRDNYHISKNSPFMGLGYEYVESEMFHLDGDYNSYLDHPISNVSQEGQPIFKVDTPIVQIRELCSLYLISLNDLLTLLDEHHIDITSPDLGKVLEQYEKECKLTSDEIGEIPSPNGFGTTTLYKYAKANNFYFDEVYKYYQKHNSLNGVFDTISRDREYNGDQNLYKLFESMNVDLTGLINNFHYVYDRVRRLVGVHSDVELKWDELFLILLFNNYMNLDSKKLIDPESKDILMGIYEMVLDEQALSPTVASELLSISALRCFSRKENISMLKALKNKEVTGPVFFDYEDKPNKEK